jgi:hypothetical protein
MRKQDRHVCIASHCGVFHNHCCHENRATGYLFVMVGIDVAVKDIKVFGVAMEMQKWVHFVLLFSYKILHTTVNSNKCFIF